MRTVTTARVPLPALSLRPAGPGRRPGGPSPSGGFTLMELLLVIGLLFGLAAILLGALGPARQMAQVADCTAHLRQIGMAIQLYRADYDQYPDPRDITLGPYLPDQRVLFCPEDHTWAALGAASSYRFRDTVPPDFSPLVTATDLDPRTVLVGCDHHLGQQTVIEKPDNTRLTPPTYPYHLVLRAGGAVTHVPLSRIKQFFSAEAPPVLRTLYPGEPGYAAISSAPADKPARASGAAAGAAAKGG